MSALTQWDWPWREAMLREWTEGRERLADALTGAARSAATALPAAALERSALAPPCP